MEPIDVLNAVCVINKDNGRKFMKTERIDAITSLLWNSKYRRVNPDGLFILYAAKPLSELAGDEVTIVSSHIDCEEDITRCFSRQEPNGMLKGTYDNAITNAAITYLMMTNALPDNTLVAFTGDEEINSGGAEDLISFLRKRGIKVRHIFVLDVTDMGWDEGADFTVENDFWNGDCGRDIIESVLSLNRSWRFVPSDIDDIPDFVPKRFLIDDQADEDESDTFGEHEIDCCSFCLPVKGEMHSNRGVLARESSFYNYTDALAKVISNY